MDISAQFEQSAAMIRQPSMRAMRPRTVQRSVHVTAVWSSLALALASGMLAASAASAQSSSAANVDPATIAAARSLAVEGVKLAQDGRCDEAIDELERAEQLFHGPIVLAQLGQCYVQVGRLVEGSEALRAVLREPLADDASDTLKRAHSAARATLETTKDKIATLTIRVHVDEGVEAQVSIDGKAVPPALLGVARPTDPGEHRLEASAPGYRAAQRTVTLEPGATETLDVALEIDPNAARAKALSAEAAAESAAAQAATAAPAEPVNESANRDASATSSRWPAYIAWGIGAIALGTGVGFGLVAIDQKNALEEACPDQKCPHSQSAKLEAAQTNGVISTVSYAVAAGAAITGGVLFYLASASDDAAAATSARASEPRARVGLGLGSAELAVEF